MSEHTMDPNSTDRFEAAIGRLSVRVGMLETAVNAVLSGARAPERAPELETVEVGGVTYVKHPDGALRPVTGVETRALSKADSWNAYSSAAGQPPVEPLPAPGPASGERVNGGTLILPGGSQETISEAEVAFLREFRKHLNNQ